MAQKLGFFVQIAKYIAQTLARVKKTPYLCIGNHKHMVQKLEIKKGRVLLFVRIEAQILNPIHKKYGTK